MTAINTAKQEALPHEELTRLFDYDPLTGILTNRITRGSTAKAGDQAGYMTPKGYRMVQLNGHAYYVSRLVWFYVHEEWPPEDIDHINGIKHDDRLANLRLATRTHNIHNQNRLSRANKSGHPGVYFRKGETKWRASMGYSGKKYYMGMHAEKDDAIKAVHYFVDARPDLKEYYNCGVADCPYQ